jgi:hypothetical protein
MMGK